MITNLALEARCFFEKVVLEPPHLLLHFLLQVHFSHSPLKMGHQGPTGQPRDVIRPNVGRLNPPPPLTQKYTSRCGLCFFLSHPPIHIHPSSALESHPMLVFVATLSENEDSRLCNAPNSASKLQLTRYEPSMALGEEGNANR